MNRDLPDADPSAREPLVTRRVLLRCAAVLSAAGGWAVFRTQSPNEAARQLGVLARQMKLVSPEMNDIGAKLARHVGPERAALLVHSLTIRLQQTTATAGSLFEQAGGWVRHDFAQARVIPVHGVNFSHTEAAFLIALCGDGDQS